jgi:hypothetical protein
MAFAEIELARVKKIVGGFCEKRVPVEIRDELRMEYSVDRHDVLLYEVRPHWRIPPRSCRRRWRSSGSSGRRGSGGSSGCARISSGMRMSLALRVGGWRSWWRWWGGMRLLGVSLGEWIAFGTFEAGFSVMDNLNGTNDAYQAFSGALRVGRAIWGEQFAVFEKAVHTAHFDLLFWSICCDGVFRAPPEDNQLTDAEWETRRSHFNETMLAFVKAMDQLSGAISQYLLAKRLQSPQSI